MVQGKIEMWPAPAAGSDRGNGLEVTHDDLDGNPGTTGFEPSGSMPASLLCPSASSKGGPLSSIALAERVTATERNTTRASATRSKVALEHAILCARSGEDNKGKDILVLDMRGITPLYDFFVIMTGTSRRQIHTLAEEIDAALAAEGEKRL